jgi:hypothetical protein
MQPAARNAVWLVIAVNVFLVMGPSSNAQGSSHGQTTLIRRLIHEFVGIGGYWFTDNSAEQALGSPKFAGSTQIYVKPAHRHNMLVTGGIELFGASDHWLLGGGNEFSLTGASFRVGGERGVLYRLSPFVNGGLFAGHIRSEKLGFSETRFTPSATLGAELKVHRYITLTGRYRVSGHIHDVNTDGYNFSLKFF